MVLFRRIRLNNVLSAVVVGMSLVACAPAYSPIAEQVVPFDSTFMADPELDEEPINPDGPLLSDNSSSLLEGQKTETLLQSVIRQGVPKVVAETGFKNYDQFRTRVKNDGYMVLIDFTKHSSKKRYFYINIATGKVETTVVAHGSGSDPENDGYGKYFSNASGSLKSSLGAYIIAERYVSGKFGPALRLDGLQSTNNKARARAVVMHGSDYVVAGKSKQGRSWGCPALSWGWIEKVIPKLRDGSFMYIYGKNRSMSQDIMNLHLAQTQNLLLDVSGRMLNESEDAPFEGD